MSSKFDFKFKVTKLKNNVRSFVAATSNGHMTPAQVRQLGVLLQENVEIIEALLSPDKSVPIAGSKIGQN